MQTQSKFNAPIKNLLLKVCLSALILLCHGCGDSDKTAKSNLLVTEKSRCQLAPNLVEGSNYRSASPLRTDIRDDARGIFVHYKLQVVNVNDHCRPVPYAVVDLWQVDEDGVYSNEGSYRLRGVQNATPFGDVQFISVIPGWNAEQKQGSLNARANHVNLKIHVNNKTVLNSEFYFPDEEIRHIYELMYPYKEQQQKRYKQNNQVVTLDRLQKMDEDFQIKSGKGEPLVMQLERIKQGYKGTLQIGVAL